MVLQNLSWACCSSHENCNEVLPKNFLLWNTAQGVSSCNLEPTYSSANLFFSRNVTKSSAFLSSKAILDVEAIEREAMEDQERIRPSTDPGPRRHKFLSPIQVRFSEEVSHLFINTMTKLSFRRIVSFFCSVIPAQHPNSTNFIHQQNSSRKYLSQNPTCSLQA